MLLLLLQSNSTPLHGAVYHDDNGDAVGMVTLLLSYKANTKIIDEVGRCERAGVGMFVFFCAIFSFPHLQRRELVGVSASPSVSSSYIYRWMALSNRAQRCMYMYDYTTAYMHTHTYTRIILTHA